MASGVGGTISLNYYSVQGLNLESRAQFATEEDRQVFLDAIKNARAQEAEGNFNSTLEFPMPLNAEALGLLPGKLTEAGEVFADTLLDMMVILHQAGQVMKKVGKEVREAERDSQVDSLMDTAQKIRDAAMMAFAAGLASGIATMGSGIMGLVGSGAAMKKTAEASKISANPGGDITAMGSDGTVVRNLSPQQQTQIQSLNSRADALRGLWQAGGQTLSGAGEMVSAGMTYASKQEEAQKAELEARATEHQYKAQNADEIVQNMRDFIKEVRQVLGEILQAQSQIESKVWS